MYLSYIAHYLENHQADDFCLMETVAGVSIHFPRCFRWRRSKLAFGQSSSNLIQLARPSVACCGLQDLGLFCHATLPSLFPGLDKADALQYLSPILNLLEVFLSRRLSTAHIIDVAQVATAAQTALYELVKGIEIAVGPELAGQVPYWQAARSQRSQQVVTGEPGHLVTLFMHSGATL